MTKKIDLEQQINQFAMKIQAEKGHFTAKDVADEIGAYIYEDSENGWIINPPEDANIPLAQFTLLVRVLQAELNKNHVDEK